MKTKGTKSTFEAITGSKKLHSPASDILAAIYAFFIEPDECRVCGRNDAFDCNENELCGRAHAALHGDGGICTVLREIVNSGILNDSRGDESGGHLLATARAVLRKPLLVPLRRKNLGIKDDAQYSPYLTGDKYVVFEDYGHPDGHLLGHTFRTKGAAQAFCDSKKENRR